MDTIIIRLTEDQLDDLRLGYPITSTESVECKDCCNDVDFEIQIESK